MGVDVLLAEDRDRVLKMSARRLTRKESWLSDRQAKGHKLFSKDLLSQIADGEGTYAGVKATEKAMATTLLKRQMQ